MENYVYLISTSFIMGVIARIYMMRLDHKQYPTYPQGLVTHITLGIIAASLGAVAIPSLAQKEYSAVTFLTLAAQQFRDVRSMERQSLDNIESTEVVPRGTAYIEDIAKAFEARNYMAILVALLTGGTYYICDVYKHDSVLFSIIIAVIIGAISALILKKLLSRQFLEDIANVNIAKIDFDGALLRVNEVVIMNIGLSASKERYLKDGLAVEIIPKKPHYIGTLLNLGQRQTIIHNVCVQLGIKKDVDEPEFVPIVRRNPKNNSIVIPIVPIAKDEKLLIHTIKRTPILESAKGKTYCLK